MLAYIVRRLLYAIPILIGVNLVTFALFFVVNTPDDMARMQLGIKRVTPEAKLLAEICLHCCQRVKGAVGLLRSMDNASAILKICHEIDKLESDADRIMREAMSKLFREESDVLQVIKLKAIYELLETVTDRCEDVANTIEGIVLENS